MKILYYPPPSTLSSQIETGAGGVQTQITEKKNSDKGVYCWFFCNYIIFFTVQKGRNIYPGGGGGGGGGGVQLLIIFFFWGGGGGWGGGTNPYFYRNLYNL